MPESSFPEYARQVTDILNVVVAAELATLLDLQIDQRSPLRGYIAGILRFEDNSELHFREFIDTTLEEPRLMYVYHYQDADKALVFRYDTAAHRPELGQPEHKHTGGEVIASPAPGLAEVIDEALQGQ